MKRWKMIIRLLAIVSLGTYVVTEEIVTAVFLLIFASMQAGIMICEEKRIWRKKK